MTAIVRFERRGTVYAITFVYSPVIVDVIKLTVPSYARSWSKPRHEWLIEAVYGKPLADALDRLGCTIIGLDPEPKPCDHDAAHWARLLFHRVGNSRADQVFRALSRCFHPDLPGGDGALQRELTDARNELMPNTKGE